jgi:hypothetical protein
LSAVLATIIGDRFESIGGLPNILSTYIPSSSSSSSSSSSGLLLLLFVFFEQENSVRYADRLAEIVARAASHSVALACAGNGISECRFCAGRIGLWQISQLTSTSALPAAVSTRCCSTASVRSRFVIALGLADTDSA